MALNKTITAQNNFGLDSILDNCYCKVERIVGSKVEMVAMVSFLNNDKNRVFFDKSYVFVPVVGESAKDFIAQAYLHLKTLPEFADAVDC